jgi:hypothetical protein
MMPAVYNQWLKDASREPVVRGIVNSFLIPVRKVPLSEPFF